MKFMGSNSEQDILRTKSQMLSAACEIEPKSVSYSVLYADIEPHILLDSKLYHISWLSFRDFESRSEMVRANVFQMSHNTAKEKPILICGGC